MRARRPGSEPTAIRSLTVIYDHPPRDRGRACWRTSCTPCSGRRSSDPHAAHGLRNPADRCVFLVAARAHREAARYVHGARLQGRAHLPAPRPAAGGAAHLPASARWTRTARWDVAAYIVALLIFNFVVLLFVYAVLRLQGVCRSTRRTSRAWTAGSPSTRPSASRPTPTGRCTSRETSVSYLTQMLALARENFVSAAVGMAVAVGLHPRPDAALARATSATSGSTSRAASSTSCCRSASSARSSSSRRASSRTSTPRPRSRPSRALRRS